MFLQQSLETTYDFSKFNDAEGSPNIEVPENSVKDLDVTDCKNLNEIIAKSQNDFTSCGDDAEHITFVAEGNISLLETAISTWQRAELLRFINKFSDNWVFLLPSLMFKFNHAITNHYLGPPFRAMFNHPSCRKEKEMTYEGTLMQLKVIFPHS